MPQNSMLQDGGVSSIRWNDSGDAIEIPSIREFEKALKIHFNNIKVSV